MRIADQPSAAPSASPSSSPSEAPVPAPSASPSSSPSEAPVPASSASPSSSPSEAPVPAPSASSSALDDLTLHSSLGSEEIACIAIAKALPKLQILTGKFCFGFLSSSWLRHLDFSDSEIRSSDCHLQQIYRLARPCGARRHLHGRVP